MATHQAAVGISLILVILATEAVVGLTPLTTYTKDKNVKPYSKAIQTCSTIGGSLLAIDSQWKYNILDHLGLFGDDKIVREGMWMDVVYDSNIGTACNGDLFVWRNCSSVGSTVSWDLPQPQNCLENKCTIISSQKWKTEKCDQSRKFVCEKISGDCTFAERNLTVEHTNFITYNLPNTNVLECESLCRTTEIYSGRTEECWLYIVEEGICFLYFGSQEMSINVTTNSGGSQTNGSQRRIFKVKTCAQLVEEYIPVPADIESDPRSQCQTTDGDPGNNPVTDAQPICTFMEASLSALEKEMENNSVFHIVLKNSDQDVCFTRCLTSTMEDLECQAVLIVTYTSDCSLYYGSNRFTFDQSSSPISDITVYFRRCRNDPTTTTTTTTTTKTTTTSTTTTTPAPTLTTTTTSTNTTTPTTITTSTSTTSTTTTTPTITQAPTIKDDETRTDENDNSGITTSTLRSTTTTPAKPRPKDEFNLTVPITSLSSFRNKYISVYESRPSAVSMGVLGGLLIVVLVALVVASDAKVIWVHVTTIGLRNIKMGFSSKVANKDKTKVEDDSEPHEASA